MGLESWKQINNMMTTAHIQAVCSKAVVFDGKINHDLYIKLGWADGRWVWVDITLSRYSGFGHCETDVDEEHRKLIETNRVLVEMICLHATELLQSGERRIEDIVRLWKGTQFEPKGLCEAIRDDLNEGRVTSILDAAAKLIEKRSVIWSAQLSDNQNVTA